MQKMLAPAILLLQDAYFWQHQSDGLAIFLSSNKIRRYRLPLNFEELMVVDDHLYIKPLLPLFTGDGQFYILALSQNKVRLLNGTRDSVSEVDIGQVGGSLAEAIPSVNRQMSFYSTHLVPPAGCLGVVPLHSMGKVVAVTKAPRMSCCATFALSRMA